MYEIFRAYAEYNRAANKEVCALVRTMSDAQFVEEHAGYYYKNLKATLLHVLNSDSKWLGRLGTAPDWLGSSLEAAERGREEYIAARARIDDALVKLLEGMRSTNFAEVRRVQFGKGEIERPLWQLLVQMFNHHTHHRGGISVLLELEGIANDYSLFLNKI